MLEFFCKHFKLDKYPIDISLSRYFCRTSGGILFADVHNYRQDKRNNLSIEYRENFDNAIDMIWGNLQDAQKSEWDRLANMVERVYKELSRLSSIPHLVEEQLFHLRVTLREIIFEICRCNPHLVSFKRGGPETTSYCLL
jgi:hypothetical protein